MQSYRVSANRKYCSYFKCGNNNVAHPGITFFAYPKDEDRYNAWIKLGGVRQRLLEDKRYHFLCERHFASCYLCHSQRRTRLLGNAVPYKFDEPVLGSTGSVEVYEMTPDGTLTTVRAPTLEENIGHESTDGELVSDSDVEQKSSFTDALEPAEEVVKIIDVNMIYDGEAEETSAKELVLKNEPKVEPSPCGSDNTRRQRAIASKIAEMKGKVLNVIANGRVSLNKDTEGKTVFLNGTTLRLVPISLKTATPNQSATMMETTTPAEDVAAPEPENVPENESNTPSVARSPVSSSTNSLQSVQRREDPAVQCASDEPLPMEKDDKISEFIFKGEEYVQMPKEHFLSKINKLKRRMAYYENVVKNMRLILDNAEPPSSLDC